MCSVSCRGCLCACVDQLDGTAGPWSVCEQPGLASRLCCLTRVFLLPLQAVQGAERGPGGSCPKGAGSAAGEGIPEGLHLWGREVRGKFAWPGGPHGKGLRLSEVILPRLPRSPIAGASQFPLLGADTFCLGKAQDTVFPMFHFPPTQASQYPDLGQDWDEELGLHSMLCSACLPGPFSWLSILSLCGVPLLCSHGISLRFRFKPRPLLQVLLSLI